MLSVVYFPASTLLTQYDASPLNWFPGFCAAVLCLVSLFAVIWRYAPAVNLHRLLLWVLCWLLVDRLSAQTHLPYSALRHWGWDPVNHTSFLPCGWLEETKSEKGEGIYSFLLCFLLLCCQHHRRVSASLSTWQLVSVPAVSSSPVCCFIHTRRSSLIVPLQEASSSRQPPSSQVWVSVPQDFFPSF